MMQKRDKKDSDTWAALKKGKRKELKELFQQHHLHLYNYGIKIIANPDAVNGAIQDLFLNLWKYRNNLSAARSIKAYLLSSLRRLLLEQQKREKARAIRNWHYINEHDNDAFYIDGFSLQQELDTNNQKQLHKALQTLTPRQKEAIFLKYYNGLTNAELTEVMGINHQCVRNLLYKAIERIRANIESELCLY